MALSCLRDAGLNAPSDNGISERQRRTIEQMIDRGFNAPFTSSAGRLFDAVAAIAGVRSHVTYEGQAAMQLEWLATNVAESGIYPFELVANSTPTCNDSIANGPSSLELTPFSIDTRPLIHAVVQDVRESTTVEVIARRFHSTIVEMILGACDRIRSQTQLESVVLTGGVFMNALLTREVCARLALAGFRVYRHRLVPPGDGGLCLGQLAIAAKTMDTQSAQ